MLLPTVTGTLATTFVAGLWQGVALAFAAGLMLRLLPKASAGLRHSLLFSIFVLATALPWIDLHRTGIAAAHGAGWQMSPRVVAAIAALWIAASLFRAAQLFNAWLHLRAVSRRAVPLNTQAFDAALPRAMRPAMLCSSTDVNSPTVLGFFNPKLLLPEWLVPTLSAEDLRQIALHEFEHLHRRDDWTNLALQVGLVLLPLNPALIWLERRISVQRELACDAAVIADTAQPIVYARCLTRMAEQSMQHRSRLRLALAAWERQSELMQRVHALLGQRKGWTLLQSRFAAAAAVMTLAAGSFGLTSVPRLASVTAPIAIAETHNGPATAMHIRTDEYAFKAVPAVSGKMPKAITVSYHAQGARPSIAMPAVMQLNMPRAAKKTKRAKGKAQLRAANEVTLPRLIRTAARDGVNIQPITMQMDGDGLPVRLVTTEFTTPYVTVPFGNGWLLIQL